MIFIRVCLLPSMIVLVNFLIVCDLNAETWRITSLDWQPYSGSDLANQGKSVEKLRGLLKKEGVELIVDFYPWLRAQQFAKTKKYVGYFPAWPEEVKEGFAASPPVDWSYVGVMTYSGSNISWESIEKLFKNFKIGIIKTYVYPKSIEDAMKKYPHNIKKTVNEVSLVKMLSTKRIDVALTDPNVMVYNAKKNNINNVEILNNNLIKKALVISFRNDEENKRRIEWFKKILKKVADAE